MKKLNYKIWYVSILSKESDSSIENVFVSDIDLVARRLFNNMINIKDIMKRIQEAIDT